MAKLCFELLICATLLFGYSVADDSNTMDELKQYYVSLIMECSKEHPLTEEFVQQLKQRQMPDNENAKCLFACVYKRGGMMDENGFMSVQGIHELTKKYVSDPATMETAMAFTEACKQVNDAKVSDGTRGCDRAALMFKCSIEKASEFNLGI